MLQPKTYAVLQMAIEQGVHSGVRRAYKHIDIPAPMDWQIEEIMRGVENALLEWFDITPNSSE